MSTFVRNPDMCSRCGAIDDRHSMKCYQAMVMGMALGFEKPQAHPIPTQQNPDLAAAGREVAALRDELASLGQQLRDSHRELRRWQHDYRTLHHRYEELRGQQTGSANLAALVDRPIVDEYANPPVTQLPPEYHEANLAGKRRAEREREIEAEIASRKFQDELDLQERLITDARKSPHLVVEEHDGATSIRPRRDDDPPHLADLDEELAANADREPEPVAYTAKASPEDEPQEQQDQDDRPQVQGEEPDATPAVVTAGTEVHDDQPTDWQAYVREQKARLGLSNGKLGKLVGASHQAVADWASGKTVPTVTWHANLRKLADVQPESAEVAPPPEPLVEGVFAAAVQFVREHVVVADSPPRTDEAGRVWNPGYVTAVEFLDAFREWCEATGAEYSVKAPFALGAELRKIAPMVKQGPTHHTPRKPTSYFGIMLASQLEELTAPEPEPEREPTKAEINAREVEETRRLIQEAKANAQRADAREAAQEAQEALDDLAAGEDPATILARQRTNNGWFSYPRGNATGVTAPELTLEQLEAENAARMASTTRERVDVERPGNEKMTPFAREFVNALLDLNAGFIYNPPRGSHGQGKQFLIAPDGSRFTIATSFGGQDELRNLRRWLNRNGYLPTNGSPISALTKPGKKGKPASPPVKVIRKDGREETVEQAAARQEGRPPLSEEEMDKTLFQLLSDCRAGLPLTIQYTETSDVLGLEGYPKDAIDRAVRNPDRVEVRPESKDKGYPILRFAKGDVTVIMGFRFPKNPAVMRAEWDALLMNDTHRVNHTGSGGSRESTGLPNTPSALRSRLQQMGATVTPSESGKAATVTYQGQNLGLMTLEKAPRATVHNDFQRMQRKMHAIDQKEAAAV